MCQACHAVADFCMRYPGRAADWHDSSNYIVVLAVKNEEELCDLQQSLLRFRYVLVDEPDLNGEKTALAVEHAARKVLSQLPLAAKEYAMVS